MSPKRAMSQYRVYVLQRGRRALTATNEVLGQDDIPAIWPWRGKTYYWSGLDDVLGIIMFSEQDPRT